MRKRFSISLAGVLVAAFAFAGLTFHESSAAPSSQDNGNIRTPWKQFEVALIKSGGERIQARGTNWECAVPAGSYDIRHVKLRGVDSKGNEWAMYSSSWIGSVEVQEGKTTWLSVGPPFEARVKPSRTHALPGDPVDLELQLFDAEGHAYGAPQSGRTGEVPPGFIVYDSQGNEIGTYKFEFG